MVCYLESKYTYYWSKWQSDIGYCPTDKNFCVKKSFTNTKNNQPFYQKNLFKKI